MDLSQIMQLFNNQGENQEFSNIIKTVSEMQNSNNNNNNNMLNMLLPLLMKNNPNLNSIMPILNMMQSNNQNFTETQSVKEEAEEKTKNPTAEKNNSGDYLLPISDIANKDITYILNRFFSGN